MDVYLDSDPCSLTCDGRSSRATSSCRVSCVVRRQQRLRAVPVVAERRIKVHVSLRLTGCQACSAALARRTQFTSFGSAECRVKIKFIQSSDRASHLGIDPDLN